MRSNTPERSLSYAWEKLHTAVMSLTSGTERIQDRLHAAYVHSLIRLKPDDLPLDRAADLQSIHDDLTSVEPAGDEGSVKATTSKMSAEAASAIAERIVSLYDAVARRYPSA